MIINEDKFLNKSAEDIANDALNKHANNTIDALSYIKDILKSDGLSDKNKQKLIQAKDIILKDKALKEGWFKNLFKKKQVTPEYDMTFSVYPPFKNEPYIDTIKVTGWDDPRIERMHYIIRNMYPKSPITARSEIGNKTFYENAGDGYTLKGIKKLEDGTEHIVFVHEVGNKFIANKLKSELMRDKNLDDIIITKNENNTDTSIKNDFKAGIKDLTKNTKSSNILLGALTGINPVISSAVRDGTESLFNTIKKLKPKKENTITEKDIHDPNDLLDRGKVNQARNIISVEGMIALAKHGIHPSIADRGPSLRYNEQTVEKEIREIKQDNTIFNLDELEDLIEFDQVTLDTLREQGVKIESKKLTGAYAYKDNDNNILVILTNENVSLNDDQTNRFDLSKIAGLKYSDAIKELEGMRTWHNQASIRVIPQDIFDKHFNVETNNNDNKLPSEILTTSAIKPVVAKNGFRFFKAVPIYKIKVIGMQDNTDNVLVQRFSVKPIISINKKRKIEINIVEDEKIKDSYNSIPDSTFKKILAAPYNAEVMNKFYKKHPESPDEMLNYLEQATQYLNFDVFADWVKKYNKKYDLARFEKLTQIMIYKYWKEASEGSLINQEPYIPTKKEINEKFWYPEIYKRLESYGLKHSIDTLIKNTNDDDLRDSIFQRIVILLDKNVSVEELKNEINNLANTTAVLSSIDNKYNEYKLFDLRRDIYKYGDEETQHQFESALDSLIKTCKKDKLLGIVNPGSVDEKLLKQIVYEFRNKIASNKAEEEKVNIENKHNFKEWYDMASKEIYDYNKISGKEIYLIPAIERVINRIRNQDTNAYRKYSEGFKKQLQQWYEEYKELTDEDKSKLFVLLSNYLSVLKEKFNNKSNLDKIDDLLA